MSLVPSGEDEGKGKIKWHGGDGVPGLENNNDDGLDKPT